MKSLIIAIFSLFFATASVVVRAGVWHTAEIINIYPNSQGNFVLQLNEDSVECESSSEPDYYWVTVGSNGVTAEGADKMYALSLAAAMAGKKVKIYFAENTTSCYINRMQLIL